MLKDTMIVKRHAVPLFFSISFLFSFLLLLPLFRVESPLDNVLLLMIYIVAGFAPTLTAILLTWLEEGPAGVGRLLRLVVNFRVKLRWYIAVLLIPLLAQLVSLGVLIYFSDLLFPVVGVDRWMLVIPFFMFNLLIFGALGEEIGWRGYLLPRLQENYSAVMASLIIGGFWAFWLFPRTFVYGSALAPGNYLWLVVELLVVSILLTWVSNSTGSLLLPILFHAFYATIPPIVAPILEVSGHLPWYEQINATVYTNITIIVLLICGGKSLVYKPRPKRVRPE